MFARTQSHALGRHWARYWSHHWGSAALRYALVLALLALTLFTGPQPAHAVATASSAPGTVVAWGSNLVGASTVPGDLSDVIAIAAGGYQNLALKSDGTVVAWGNNNDGQGNIPAGLANVTAIAAGNGHNLALKGDGTVVAWGSNNFGQATVPSGLADVTAIAAGWSHSLALKADGTVVAWGFNGDRGEGLATVPAGLDNVIAIAAGDSHNLALKGDGTVVAWGGNNQGQATVPAGLANVIAIAAGAIHSLALQGDGTVVAWGSNTAGQATVPGTLTNVIAIAAGGYHSLALKGDGTAVAWGDNYEGQATVPSGLTVIAIAAGNYHSVALVPSAAAAPEIDVTGNGVSIANGDSTPDPADHTDFGSADIDGGTVVRTFTISNTGDADLTLDGSPLVAISGDQAAEFTVTALPSSPVAAGDSTTFQITFDPGAVGARTATVTIANDDGDENPYTFAVQGTGIVLNAQLNGTTCDLIDAINAANSDTASGTCPAGSSVVTDTITLLSDVILATNYDSNNGLPPITSAIAVDGAGYTISRTVDAPEFRFFAVNSTGDLTLDALTLQNGGGSNFFQSGGAIYTEGRLTVNNSVFRGNSVARYGGALYSEYNISTVVNNSTFSGNTTDYGGALYTYYATLTVNNSTFSDNSATDYGGVLYNDSESATEINNSTFSDNSATDYGGAIYNYYATLTITNSTFSGNSADYGGAIYSYYDATLTITGSTFSGNSADYGGAIYSYDEGSTEISNSTFSGNSAAYYGGAIYSEDDSPIALNNSTITGNSADDGGAIYIYDTSLTLNRTLLAGNSAGYAAEIYNDGGTVNADSFNLFGDSSKTNAQALYGFTPGGSDITATSNGTTPTALSAILNPTLADNGGPTLTHALVDGSPAIDAAGDSGLETDQRGVPRPQDAPHDIGAVEFYQQANQNNGIAQSHMEINPFNFVAQTCGGTGLPTHTIMPTLRNSGSVSYTDLYFEVIELRYSVDQGGNVPTLCNAHGGQGGGTGARVLVDNTVFADDNVFNPNDTFDQLFVVGLPVRARYRLFVNLYGHEFVERRSTDARPALGQFVWEFDENGNLVNGPTQLFLPFMSR